MDIKLRHTTQVVSSPSGLKKYTVQCWATRMLNNLIIEANPDSQPVGFVILAGLQGETRAVYEREGFRYEGTLRECLKGPEGFESLVVMSVLEQGCCDA